VQSKRRFERGVAHRVAWPPNLVVTTVITLMSLFAVEGHTRTNRKEARHLKTLNLISSYLLTNGFEMTVPCSTLRLVKQQDIYTASTCCCFTQAYQPYTIMIYNTRTCSVLFRSKDSKYTTRWPKTQHQFRLEFITNLMHQTESALNRCTAWQHTEWNDTRYCKYTIVLLKMSTAMLETCWRSWCNIIIE
jgi:hypothetical protein